MQAGRPIESASLPFKKVAPALAFEPGRPYINTMTTLMAYCKARTAMLTAEADLKAALRDQARDPAYPFIADVIASYRGKVARAQEAHAAAQRALTIRDVWELNQWQG